MAENSGQEKTEQPTPRKRQKARDDGQVARSQDLTAAASLAAAMVLLYLFGRHIFVVLLASMRSLLGNDLSENPTRLDDLGAMTGYAGMIGVHALGPMLLTLAVVVLVASFLQVGFLLTGKPLIPKLSKLDPLKGAKNLVNMRAGVRFLQSLGKLTVMLGVGAVFISWQLPLIVTMPGMEPAVAMGLAAWIVFKLAVVLSVLLIVLAIADYAYQRWQQTEDLKMTKEEVRREMKDMDGDPLVKQRRARVARQLAMQRVAAAIPQADVVVTNPTHYAVALQYDAETMRAPKVVAKGADFMALRIRQLAAVHGVPMIERKPLARGLYGSVEVGQEVPAEHYAAVAELLAYVYRLSGKRAG